MSRIASLTATVAMSIATAASAADADYALTV